MFKGSLNKSFIIKIKLINKLDKHTITEMLKDVKIKLSIARCFMASYV